MRIKHYSLTLCMILLTTGSLLAKTVTVTEAGQLSSLISDEELNSLTELTISGPLNGEDILIIRTMGGTLQLLDMKEARIVEDKASSGYYTQNDVIGYNMFHSMGALKKVVLPKDVWSIGAWTKDNPWDAEKTVVDGSPGGGYSFAQCTNLQEVVFPSTLLWIGDYAFSGCSKLTTFTLPSGIEGIGQYAFEGCVSLKSVSIPASFGIGNKLTWEYLSDFNFESDSYGYNDRYGAGIFSGCTNLSTVTLADGIKRLSYGMFHGCTSLTSIQLPSSLLRLNSAFTFCSGLTSITLPNTLAQVGSFAGCSALTSISIPNGATFFGAWFQGCSALTSVSLPSSLTAISNYAFAGCSALKEITLPSGVKTIGEQAFAECSQLHSITLPDALRDIGTMAFYGSGLKSISFPRFFSALGDRAFLSCEELESVELSIGLSELPSRVFSGCTKLNNVVLPNNVLTIGDGAFYNCTALSNIVLPTNLQTIESEAFSGCNLLKTITLPAGIKEINGLSGSGIQSIQYAEGATPESIAKYAFSRCDSLKTLPIPSSVKSIGRSAFEYCALDSLIIPSSVTSIDIWAFEHTTFKTFLSITPNSALVIGGLLVSSNPGKQIPNLYWNSSTQFPNEYFRSITNLYLPADGSTSSTYEIDRIFYGGVTDSIAVAYTQNYVNSKYEYSYSVPKAMKAKKVTYTKNFNTTSGYQEAAGWKTLVLPFDVKEITYKQGSSYSGYEYISLAPFGSTALETAGTLPFWLYELGTDGNYKAATQIKANQAYLICMPNNNKYPSSSNISGNVTFAATDLTNGITLQSTVGSLIRSKGTKFDLVPTYDGVMQHDTVYVLNEGSTYYGDDKNYAAGSVFIKNYTPNYSSDPAVYPFQAYLVSNEESAATRAPLMYSIGGGDGITTGIPGMPLTPDQATKAYSRDGVLYIDSNAERTIRIYNMAGQTVRIVELREGINEVTGLDSGIYLLEGQKVVVTK